MNLSRTILMRGVIGPLFVGHGTQKLFGWLGGHGLEGTERILRESSGCGPGSVMPPPRAWPRRAAELLLTLGAFTPLATTAISATMITAMRKVHPPEGPVGDQRRLRVQPRPDRRDASRSP